MDKDLLEKHRYMNVDFADWCDSAKECFTADMAEIGIRVDAVSYTGFYSQGDGAEFIGCVVDWPKFLRSLGYDDPWLEDHAQRYFEFARGPARRYYYDGNDISSDLPLPNYDEDADFSGYYLEHDFDDVRTSAALIALNKYSSDGLYREFAEAFRRHADALYTVLFNDYEYLTSDEAVWEAIVANELNSLEEA